MKTVFQDVDFVFGIDWLAFASGMFINWEGCKAFAMGYFQIAYSFRALLVSKS